jgi:DNA repair protein RadC
LFTLVALQPCCRFIDIASPLGISVHDQIIVGKNGYASMKGLRLI